MNLFDFRRLVFETAKFEGTPYLGAQNIVELNELIQRGLDTYCAESGCLSTDECEFTPAVGFRTYDLKDDDIVSRRMCEVRHVILNGSVLYSLDSLYPGESSESLAIRKLQAYQTEANGDPQFWWLEEPDKLKFNCPFAAVLPNCFLSGNCYHSTLPMDMGELDLGPKDIAPASRFCAAELLMVYSRDKAFDLLKVVRGELQERIKTTVKTTGGSQRRQSSENGRTSLR